MSSNNKAVTPAPQDTQNLTAQPKALTFSERFTNMVAKELAGISPGAQLTQFQKRLAQNYFVKLDQSLAAAETKRMAKSEQYREALAYTWANLNMNKLALDVVAFSSVGLDPLQPNHISMVPYKNNSTNKYEIGFIPGYRGVEVKAKKYGLDLPIDTVVELVYSKDAFKAIKKDINNKVESYIFDIADSFDRGELIGGFYYHAFADPTRNILVTFNKQQIEKRKPKYASPEFWGGEKTTWKDGKKVGTEIVEGWVAEMYYKTVYRAAYNSLTIDSSKIDAAFTQMIAAEDSLKDEKIQAEINLNANKEEIGFVDEPAHVDAQPETQEAEILNEAKEVVHSPNPAQNMQETTAPPPGANAEQATIFTDATDATSENVNEPW